MCISKCVQADDITICLKQTGPLPHLDMARKLRLNAIGSVKPRGEVGGRERGPADYLRDFFALSLALALGGGSGGGLWGLGGYETRFAPHSLRITPPVLIQQTGVPKCQIRHFGLRLQEGEVQGF